MHFPKSADSSRHISKPDEDSTSFPRHFRITVRVSIIMILLLGSLDLAGWVFGITVFKSILPFWEPMKIITAICLIFTGTSLLFLQINRPSFIAKIFPRILASIICLISLLTICIYLFKIRTGIELSLTEMPFIKLFFGGVSKMAFLTSFNLSLTGCIIILLSDNNKRTSGTAHILIIPISLISYYVLLSYILGVNTATRIGDTSVALNTGIAFCCICVAVLFMKPDTWLLKIYTSSDTGGLISRRLLPPLMILPVVIGWLRIRGERTGLFESEEGVLLVAITYSISFLFLIWITARYISRIDRQKNTSEKALRESEERFKAMAEISPVGMGVVKIPDGIFLYVNPAYEEYFGYNKDELLGKKSVEIYFDRHDRDLIYKKLAENNFVSNFEIRLKRKDGSAFWTLSSIKPIIFDGKEALLGTFIDISRRKAAEESLKVSEQKLKYHFENSPLAVVEWDKEYLVTQWSLEAEHIFGWKKEEVFGKSLMALHLVYEEDMAIVTKTIERLNGGEELVVTSSNRNYTKSGEVIECIWYNSVLVDEDRQMSSVISLIQDVTFVKKTERELIESKESYKELVTNAKSIIIKQDTNGIITFLNEFGQEFFGFKEREIIEKTAMETIVPEIESSGRKLDIMVERIYEDPDKFSVNVNENIKKSGERVWIEWHNKALFDTSGNRTGHMAIGVDITERLKAEEALKDTQEKLRSVLNATQESVYMFDREGRFLISNATGVRRLSRASEKELVGHNFTEFMKPELARDRYEKLEQVFVTGKALEFEDERNGMIFHHNFFPVIKNDKVAYVVTYSTDITERKKRETELEESQIQLLELVATKDKFFNIVAHDLKNPFTSLLGSSELLYMNIHQMEKESIRELALILNDSAKGGYAILQNLLDWSRSQTGQIQYNPERIHLNAIIENNLANIQLHASGKEISLHYDSAKNIFIVSDRNMINTIMRNLLGNAVKYTGRGGKVFVTTTIEPNEIQISVKDTGTGISKEEMDKLFRLDSKFSKPGTANENGTGLGLKLCREFAEKMGGKIIVESIENKGSEFILSIPVQ
jgi:PAS domain S-box-containing protein